MNTLLLGIAVGLATLIPLGPMSLSVIGVGLSQGRSRGSQAGLGVVGGDAVSAVLAIALIMVGGSLPTGVLSIFRHLSSVVLFGFGAAMVFGPKQLQVVAGGMQRPLRSMLAATTLSPLTLGAWFALFMAMPFSSDTGSLTLFAIGGVVASLAWHPLLGASAGFIGPRLNPSALAALARAGGFVMIGFALYLAFGGLR